MRVIKRDGIYIKMWLDEIEESAKEQAFNLSELPFAFHHVAIMPDCHTGYGMPIGGVLATGKAVIPNAVGVDIGCGMMAVKTDLVEISKETLKLIMDDIRKTVPVGFEHQKEPIENNLVMPSTIYPVMKREESSIDYQLGTLGGGNHFIEIQKGSDGFIWFMLHTGSRNFGKQVCDYYNRLAREENIKWHSEVNPKWDLAFIPLETDLFKAYMSEMDFALDFARENRRIISEKIKESFTNHIVCNFEKGIDVHHNYAAWENHFGENVIIHRKGATSAREGQTGIIPGSQGTASYIVVGLGNPESFMSCSHGAGRIMSRSSARKNLDLETERKKLDEKGIIHAIRNEKDLDEASGAYKNIDQVMKNQEDLVRISVELKPLGVIKG